jgi:hypothetical protein
MTQAVEHLPSIYKDLGSKPNTENTKSTIDVLFCIFQSDIIKINATSTLFI